VCYISDLLLFIYLFYAVKFIAIVVEFLLNICWFS
jgi:hypothetical protein